MATVRRCGLGLAFCALLVLLAAESRGQPGPEKPEAAPLPAVKDQDWCRNGIDRFILARLEKEGLTPSPEADRTTLIRRVYLDLLGLLPEPREVENFLNDQRPDAYEKLVDRLLA